MCIFCYWPHFTDDDAQLTVPRSPITFDDKGMHVSQVHSLVSPVFLRRPVPNFPLQAYSSAIDAMRARESAHLLAHSKLPASTPPPKTMTPSPSRPAEGVERKASPATRVQEPQRSEAAVLSPDSERERRLRIMQGQNRR